MDQNLSIRPLIVGAGGLVGRTLTTHLEQRYPHTVSACRAEIDICDRWSTEAEIERLEPNVVINCAAMSNVDACEEDPEQARRINGEGPAHLAAICRRAGIRLIHFSTDYVFDGAKQEEYDEADPVQPVNEYGWSKLRGEQAVLETLAEAVVLRVSFVFGGGRPTFIDKIAGQLLEGGAEPIPVFDGWVSRPTYTREIAKAVELLLESGETGLWHVANPPAGSRYDFARRVAEILGRGGERLVSVDPSTVDLPARRPPRSPLSTRRFEARFGAVLRNWTECAGEYLLLHPPAGLAAGDSTKKSG